MLVKTIQVPESEWTEVKMSIVDTHNDLVFSEYCLALKTYSHLNSISKYNHEHAIRYLSKTKIDQSSIAKIIQSLYPSSIESAERPTLSSFPLAKKETENIRINEISIVFDDKNYIIYWEQDENEGVTHNA